MIDILLVLLMCIIGFLPMYLESKRGTLDFFNIKNAFILYFVIQLGFSGLISISSKYPSEIGISPVYFREYYTRAFLISNIGLLFFQIGYYISIKKSIKIPSYMQIGWKKLNVLILASSFFLIGWLAFFLFLMANGGMSQFLANRGEFRTEGIVGQGFLIFPATHIFNLSSILYAIVKIKPGQKSSIKHIIISTILLTFSVVPAFLMAFRGLMILPVLEFLVIINYKYKTISLKKLVPISIVIVAAFISYGIIRELPANIEIKSEQVFNLIDENPELLYSILSRSKGTEVLASEIKKLEQTNEFDFGYKSFVETLTIFIPGKLWGDKPQPSSVRFTTYFFADDLAFSRGVKNESWGGISPTIVGEFYWHFGLGGVIVGLFLFGAIVAKIYNTFIRNKRNLFVLFLYAEIFPMMIMMAEAVQGYANSLVLYFIAWTFIYFMLRIRYDL